MELRELQYLYDLLLASYVGHGSAWGEPRGCPLQRNELLLRLRYPEALRSLYYRVSPVVQLGLELTCIENGYICIDSLRITI